MAPATDPPKAITLNIKVPPGHLPDGRDEFAIPDEVPVSESIGRIRHQLSQSLPSRPASERLRILFGGRALVDDDQTLGDALNIRRDPSQTKYYVHLLVKGDGAANAPIPRASSHMRGVSTPTRSASPANSRTSNEAVQGAQPGPPSAVNHPHAHPQHQQAHQAAVLSQQQQYELMRSQQHAIAQQMQQQQLQATMQQYGPHQRFNPVQAGLPFGAFQPAFPPQMLPGLPQGMGVATPPNVQIQGQHAAPQNGPPQTDGAAERGQHPRQASLAPDLQPQRSASQPPPQALNRGMHIEGVGPGGERVVIHQQTMNFNPLQMGQQNPIAMRPPGFPAIPGMPPQNQAPRTGPSALDQARDNITEMRRMLDEIRSQSHTDEQRARVEQLERRTQSLNDYIDPLRLGTSGRAQAAQPHLSAGQPLWPSAGQQQTWQQQAQRMRQSQMPSASARSSNSVSAYLLSSPTGPQAILFSPQHGTFTSSQLRPSSRIPLSRQPTPTTQASGTAPIANPQGQPNQHAVAGQGPPAQAAQVQVAAAQPDPLGPMAPLINHLWLLLRILIFAYFLLGANLGWRRPLALMAIGIGFWLMRQGLLGDGAVVRRWWDGIVNDGRPRQAQAQAQQQNEAAQQQQGQPGAADARVGQMPTPEQVAQRLLDENQRLRNERLQWLREYLRPVERTVALLVASLFPGIGEAYVRGREEEERRRVEEEIAARRREEEERQQREEEEKKRAEEAESGSDANKTQSFANDGVAAASETAQVADQSQHTESEKAGPV